MCGGDPWACHRDGLSFKYVVPCLWVNQCVGWCIGMVGRDQRSDLWDIKIWSGVCMSGTCIPFGCKELCELHVGYELRNGVYAWG
jgi:hypothetical protein